MAGRGALVRTAAFVAGMAFLVGLASAVVLGVHRDLQTGANVAGVVAAALALPVVCVPLWAWWRRGLTPVLVTSAGLTEAAEVLADLVAAQWRTESLLRSLDDPDPMPVRWRVSARTELMDRPANLTAGAFLGGSGDAIAELSAGFHRMRRRRLVILGGAGAGKTTLAVQLVRHLLTTRRPDEPVPVLVSLWGWDVDRLPSLTEWVAAELERGYPVLRGSEFPPDLARLLVSRGRILPVLDGLDELPDPAQAAVIGLLNRSLADGAPLILTSRTPQYAAAVDAAAGVLRSAMVIEPDPLAPEAAADYLERCLPPRPHPAWDPVLDALRAHPDRAGAGPGAALGEVAATPLGLWLLRTVYLAPGADPAELLDRNRFRDAPALRAHLFAHLVEALIRTRPPPRAAEESAEAFRPRTGHDPVQVRQRLGLLAAQLNRQGTRDLAWWRLAADTRTFDGRTRATLSLLGLVFLGLPAGVLYGRSDGLDDGLLAWGLQGLVGLLIGTNAKHWANDPPGYTDLRVGRDPIGLFRKLAEGFAVGVALTLFGMVTVGVGGGLLVGLVVALPGGLLLGLSDWAESPTQLSRATTPMGSWLADRALNLQRIGVNVLVIGLAFGAMGGLRQGLASGLAQGLASGLPLGLAMGLTSGNQARGVWGRLVGGRRVTGHRAWQAYLVATWRLARAGLLPRRLMPFLDDCHRLGLLRAVGPVYQFRHAELHDHLATGHRPTAREERLLGTSPRPPRFRFWRRFLELTAAMVVGTAAVNLVLTGVTGLEITDLYARYPTPYLLTLAAGLGTTVGAWMLVRRLGRRNAALMAASILLTALPFLALSWLVDSPGPARVAYRASALLVMLAVMFRQRGSYPRP